MTNAMEERGDQVELVAIEGEQLSAVTFVQDYVQLHFDGPVITMITWPIVVDRGASIELGAPGFRDRLCSLIARRVVRAYVRPGDRLQIDFADHASVIVSLEPEAYRAAEAVTFRAGKTEEWASW